MSSLSIKPKLENGSAVRAAVINLSNTLIGAGVLAMPFAISQTSIFWGILFIICSGTASGLGLYFQGLSSSFVEPAKSSFFSLSLVTHPALSVVFDAAIAVKCFGVGVSYLIVVAQLMPQVVKYFLRPAEDEIFEYPIFESKVVWVTAALIIAGPLSFARHLESLKYTSIVALASVGYLVVLVLVKFGQSVAGADTTIDTDTIDTLHTWRPSSAMSVLSVLPVLVFSFTCHQNMFASINELVLFNQAELAKHDPSATSDPDTKLSPRISERTLTKMVAASIYPAAVTYIAVGVAGYLTFGNGIQGNIMTMYEYSLSTVIGRIAIVVMVLFSYPLQVHPCRASISNIIHWFKTKRSDPKGADIPLTDMSPENSQLLEEFVEPQVVVDKPSTTHLVHDSHIPLAANVAITTTILLLSFLLAIKVDSLQTVLAFVGATGSTSISFILPGLFAYTLLKRVTGLARTGNKAVPGFGFIDIDEYHVAFYGAAGGDVYKKDRLRMITAAVLCVGGVVTLVVCLGVNLWGLIK